MDQNTIKLFGSKKTDNWQTPKDLMNEIYREFDINFDPCPLNSTFDGLECDWNGNCYVNPPYSKVKEFLIKAHEELKNGNAKTIVFLTFANTDTAWFHDYVLDKAEIRFIRGRLRFIDENDVLQGSAMRPSILIIFKGFPELEHDAPQKIPVIDSVSGHQIGETTDEEQIKKEIDKDYEK